MLKSFIYCAKTSFLAKANDPITDLDPDKIPILQFNSPKVDNSSPLICDSSSLVKLIVGKVFLEIDKRCHTFIIYNGNCLK